MRYEVRFVHPIDPRETDRELRELEISAGMLTDRKLLAQAMRKARVLSSGVAIREMRTKDAGRVITLFPARPGSHYMHSVTLVRLHSQSDIRAHIADRQTDAQQYAEMAQTQRTQRAEYTATQFEARRELVLAHIEQLKTLRPAVELVRHVWLCGTCACAACNGDVSGVESDTEIQRIWQGLEALGTRLSADYSSETREGIEERYYQDCACCGHDICGAATRFALMGEVQS